MGRRLLLFFGAAGLSLLPLFPAACGGSAPSEPKGKPVTLAPGDLDKGFIKKEARRWYAWHTKGLDLVKENRLEEALYCFNQALEAWPKTRKKLPTDTYLQKAFLFLKMKRPRLAILYFDKFEKVFPGNKYAEEGRKRAEKMLSDGK